MKYIKIFISAILALTLTACSDTSTAEVTETSAEMEESITTVSEETTSATVSETDTLSAESEETTAETTEKETAEEPIDEPVAETNDLDDEPESPDEYKDLYKAFLTDLTNTYGDYDLAEGEEVYGEPDIVCFDLCDIDNDGVPELFVSEDGYRQTTADIYTVADGEVVKLDSKGDFGRVLITEKYIAETYVGMGCINVDIFAKNGNSLESVVSIKDYRQGFNLDAADRCCMLNDEIVSEEAMQKELDKYTSMQWYSVGRNYALCTKAINAFFESDVEKAAQITGKYSTKLVETD